MWGLLGGLLGAITFLSQPLLFLLRCIGLGYFIISNDEEQMTKIIRYLEKTTMASTLVYRYGKTLPSGTFISFRAIGYYILADKYSMDSGQIHIITTHSFFKKLTKCEDISVTAVDTAGSMSMSMSMSTVEKKKCILPFYSRVGSYDNLYYTRRNIDITEITAIGEQEKIVSSIVSIFNEKKRATIFLHGSCGTGKSTVGLLVAKELGGSFCHTFNPTNPGDTLHLVVRESSSNEESTKPIIIVIEEANSMIHRIHTNKIELHKNIHTLVYNKSTYNTFLDDMILYKNVILILTSNESIEDMSALDPCYLRKGRIDGSFSMMTPIVL